MSSTAAMRSAQLPLAMASEGETVKVSRVKGDQELKQHLSELGFVEGADVKVVTRSKGDVIVTVKGARLGLNRLMANHVMVSPAA